MQVTRINNEYNSNRYNQVAFKHVVRNDIVANPRLTQAIKDKNVIVLISGASGVGKDTVMGLLREFFNKIVHIQQEQ